MRAWMLLADAAVAQNIVAAFNTPAADPGPYEFLFEAAGKEAGVVGVVGVEITGPPPPEQQK